MVKETPGTTQTPASEREPVAEVSASLSLSNIIGLAATALVLLALIAVLVVRLQQANQVVSSAPTYPLVGHPAPDFTAPVWNGTPGQTVHLASRMEQLAAGGGVRLTAETVALVEGYVQVRSLGPLPIKGLPAPIEVFELLGAEQARTRIQAAAIALEQSLVDDYAAALADLADPGVLQTAATILAGHAQHLARLRAGELT